MDLKTRLEVLPCGKCEDMIDCDNCGWNKEADELYEQVRAEVIDEFVENITLPIISEEQLNDILDKLKEKQDG